MRRVMGVGVDGGKIREVSFFFFCFFEGVLNFRSEWVYLGLMGRSLAVEIMMLKFCPGVVFSGILLCLSLDLFQV